MCQISHFVVVVYKVDACIDQPEVGCEFHVAGIEHVGQQGQVVLITVGSDGVVFVG